MGTPQKINNRFGTLSDYSIHHPEAHERTGARRESGKMLIVLFSLHA
jgi:hypothetical protein